MVCVIAINNLPLIKPAADRLHMSQISRTTPPDARTRKRRGRYAHVPSAAIPTINSRFSIQKDHNHGLDFQYDTVVRNQEERRQMLGDDCECCHEVGPRIVDW